MIEASNLATLWGRVWIDELARSGVRHAVIAPGSRSTPLALAAAAHPDIEDLSVIDERSAAFLALGLAQATGGPAVVISTSGTAAGNFLPAVMEADRWGVPLLVLTADRPASLRDTGDSQAANQTRLYGHHVRWFHDPGVPDASETALAAARSAASEAWARALGLAGRGGPGPVHLNLPFGKPLEPGARPVQGEAGALPEGFELARSRAAQGREDGAPWRQTVAGRAALAPTELDALAARLAGARRPLILAGALPAVHRGAPGRRLGAALRMLAPVWPAPVWAEAASQVRLDPERAPTVVGTADALATSERLRRELAPDLVVRLGEAPLGWPLRRWTRELAAAGVPQVAFSADGLRRDPEHAVALQVTADPAGTLEALAARWRQMGAPEVEPGWTAHHARADRAAREALEAVLGGSEDLSEGALLTELAATLPEGAGLHVSASLPLRDVETFLPGPAPGLELSFNRGLNGIDGVVSTAAGVTWGRRVPHLEPSAGQVLLTGDVAFAHDLSGLLAAARLRVPLPIVLVDNGGGAIFDELPLAADEASAASFERHFTTPPGMDVEALCRGVGAGYFAPADRAGFRDALGEALAVEGPAVVHVRVDAEESRWQRRRVMEEMVGAAEGEALEGERGETGMASTEVASSGRPGDRPLRVAFLHGFTGRGEDLGELGEALAGGGVELVAFDLPGHGTQGIAPGMGFDDGVRWVLGELDRRGLRSDVHLAGYSLGGRLALGAVLAAPERFASLALVSATAGIEDDGERAERRLRDGELAGRIERDGLASFVDSWLALPLFAGRARGGHGPERVRWQGRLSGSARGYARALRAFGQGSQPSFWGRLGELELPVLVVAGEDDDKYAQLARRLERELPRATVEILSETGHGVVDEAPERLAGLLGRHVMAPSGS